jgi:protein TonB
MNAIRIAAAAVLLAAHGMVGAADMAYFSEPSGGGMQKVSMASDPRAYKLDAARHIYASYANRIYKGRLPPLIHAVVVVETTVDSNGTPRDVKVVRGPSHAPDVTAAVVQMIRRAGLPPHGMTGGMKFTEIWLVHKDGRFQLDSLTEGQD